MTPRHIIKMLVPTLLFVTTFFPVYVAYGGTQTNLYGLVGDMPLAAFVPLLFFASIIAAFAATKWSSRVSAILVILGIIFGLMVNGSTDTGAGTPEPYTSIVIILYFLVTPIAYIYLLVSGRKKRRVSNQEAIADAPFLAMRPWRFVVLTVCTLGFYYLYWHYQNWDAVRIRQGSGIRPFWRMAFWPIWIYSLFRIIIAAARERGYKARYSAKILASAYLAVVVASIIPGIFFKDSPWWLLVASLASLTLGTLILLQVQKAANFATLGTSKPDNLARKFTAGELAVVVAGVLAAVCNVAVILNSGGILGNQAQQKVLLEKAQRLQAEYIQCAGALNERYASLDTNDQTAVDDYNADYNACEAVRLEQDKTIKEYFRAVLPFY